MEFAKIMSDMNTQGFSFVDGKKIIGRLDVYKEELEKCMNYTFPDEEIRKSVSFATFRANMYNIGYGDSIDKDYEQYKALLIQNKIEILQNNTFWWPEAFTTHFATPELENQFNKIESSSQTFLLNSYHYGSYTVLLNFFLSRKYNVYIMCSEKKLKEHAEQGKILQAVYNKVLNSTNSVTFINAEDYATFAQLANLSNNRTEGKNVILTFIEGNKGSIDANKSLETIHFLGKDMHLRERIPEIAKILNIPLVNAIMLPDHDSLKVIVNGIFDFSKEKLNTKKVSEELFSSFEPYATKEKIYNWRYIIRLHEFMDKRNVDDEARTMEIDDYDENRFTLVNFEHNSYIFDSKYYLFYKTYSENEPIVDQLSKLNIKA